MKRHTEQRTVRSFVRRMPTINLQPTFQRGAVWTKKQKQLLIDSILTDLDIPKIYLHELDDDDEFDEAAVDGQQRLTAITEFFNNEFPLSNQVNDIGNISVKGKRFVELTENLKDKFESYELTVITLADASLEDVEEMFLRLQNGTSLNPAEKRNAMRGEMTLFIRSIAQHKFFESCGFKNNRFTFDNIAAQMALVAISGNAKADVGNTELVKLYEKNEEFDHKSAQSKIIASTLDYLHEAFPEKTPELTKLTALSLFSIALHLRLNYSIKNMEENFGTIFHSFEVARREDLRKPIGERNDYLKMYQEACASSTTSGKSTGIRFDALLQFYLEKEPNLPLLDGQRSFTEEQRLFIFRRDKQKCQLKIKCEGKSCEWNDWHADHVIPWSKGGATTVENGQIACVECNLAKGGET